MFMQGVKSLGFVSLNYKLKLLHPTLTYTTNRKTLLMTFYFLHEAILMKYYEMKVKHYEI